MRAAIATLLLLAGFASVNATPTRRDGCNGLSGTDDVPNFKLIAVLELGDSITYPSLGLVPEIPTLMTSFIAVSDKETVFNMTGGSITSNGAVSERVGVGEPLLFLSLVQGLMFPAYCSSTDNSISLPGGNENIEGLLGVLAANGDAKNFSLCERPNGGPDPAQIVVYDSQKGNGGFNISSCVNVTIVLVQA